MGMLLPVEEPEAGPWRAVPLVELADQLLATAAPPDDRPAVVALDGRSASGKTSLAERLCAAVPRSAVVHSDDVAWHHSFFDWAELMVTGVLEPVHRGEDVHYRPPAWEARGREGAIEVPSGLDLLVVEGVGAARRELAGWLDVVVWVQADVQEAERRGLVRDVASGADGNPEQVLAFWREWEAEERPFVADQRPWERATVVVAGTPPRPCADGHVLVAPPPVGTGRR